MIILKTVCCLLIIQMCKPSRILAVFPSPSYSHHEVFRPFTEELLKLGHEVVVITPYPAFNKDKPTSQNVTEIDVGYISKKLREELFEKFKDASDIFTKQKMCYEIFTRLIYSQIKTEQVQHFLKDKTKHFDLVIVEAHVPSLLVFSHVFNAPVVQISSFGATLGMFEPVGAATHPILFPTETIQKFHNLMFWEKLIELFKHYRIMREYYITEEAENKMLKELFGPNTPDISELMKNVAVVLLSIHHLWDFNRPVPPNVIYLGALSHEPQGNLSEELHSYFENSTNGVIYVSFGTNVDEAVLTPNIFNMIVKVFSKLPYDFLVQWNENVELPKTINNIKISKWLPQINILRHPKTKLFITHGGIHSTHEAIAAGVPLIGIPMIFDQWINVERYVKFQIGEKLYFSSMNENALKVTIEKVMKDKSYRNNVNKLRRLMFDQTQKPMERAIWWTEFVLRHGKETNMRPPSAGMHWIVYYEVELVCLIAVSLSAIVLIALKSLKWLFKFLLSKKTKSD